MEGSTGKWLLSMITIFRREYNQLSENEQKSITPPNDFHRHLQIEYIKFKNPGKGFMLQTFFPDRPDLEINVHGPIEAYNYVDFIEEFLSDKKWNREDPETDHEFEIFPEHRNLKSRLEELFASNIRWIKRAEKPYPKRHSHILAIGNFGYVWFLVGNLDDLDPNVFACDIINSVKKRVIARTTPRKPSAAPKRVSGYGTYFYPPIWIDAIPKLDFREKASGGLFRLHENELFSVPYKENMIVMKRGGFITVTESDKLKAKDFLNEIFATALIKGIPSYAVRETELDNVTVEENTGRMVGYASQMDSMRSTIRERLSDTSISLFRFEREIVSQGKIREIIEESERITSKELDKNQLLDLLESYTHFHNAEYRQSFVFSWLILEREISRLWVEYLKNEEIKGERKRSLSNTASWTIHIIMETLTLVGIIDARFYLTLKKFRNKRNRVIHRGENVTLEDAEECHRIAFDLITRSQGNYVH